MPAAAVFLLCLKAPLTSWTGRGEGDAQIISWGKCRQQRTEGPAAYR